MNLRNTRRIYEVVRPHYRGFAIEPVRPEGTSVEWIELNDPNEQRAQISNIMKQITSSGGRCTLRILPSYNSREKRWHT
jgi:hypothetical protein